MGADVAGHDDHRVFKIHRTPLPVGEAAVIKNLQQNPKHIVMSFFDFVEQNYGIRLTSNGFGLLPAFFITHISGRHSEKSRYGVFLHLQ